MELFHPETLARIQTQAEKTSVDVIARELLDLVHIDLRVFGEVPSTGPVLLVSNHPSALDGLIYLAAAGRSDLHFVAIAAFKELGGILAEHILPVYRRRLRVDVILQTLAPEFLHHVVEDRQMAQQLNQETIKEAAQLVNQSSAVLIFPTGSGGSTPEGSTYTWKSGVGHLATQIVHPEAQIVFAQIEGTQRMDILRYVAAGREWWPKRRKPVQVTFAPPQLLSTFTESISDGKALSRHLEVNYRTFFSDQKVR